MSTANTNSLHLYWSTSSDASSKQLSLSPTKYEDCPCAKSKYTLINVNFSRGPLIEIHPFPDNECFQDEINSLQTIRQHYLDKEKQYLLHLETFIKTFHITKEHFKIYNKNIMRISWTLCQSRRIFQQSLQYMYRYLSSIKTNQFSLNHIDLLGCVCLRLSAKHNMCRYERNKIKRDDFKPKYYLKLLRTQYNIQQFNKLECNVLKILQFDLDYPTIYDFVVNEMETLLMKIPQKHSKYYQSIYLKPSILLKLFQVIDFIALDIESVNFKPSLIASCILQCCFNFENWEQGIINISNTNHHRNHMNYMPRLMTPTPTPTPSPFAKLGGQILNKKKEQCIKLVNKYLTIDMKYWEPPKYIFDYEKTLTNNILKYQTWRDNFTLNTSVAHSVRS